MPEEQKTFTLDELAAFDGKDGRPVYVAYKGKVFDVSGSKLWKTGRHMNRHDSGLDLTVDLSQAPHGEDRLERYPQVGVVAGAGAVKRADGHDQELPWLLRKSPFLRRHPHPMTVHFPIAFATGAALFLAFYLLTGAALCESAVHAMNIAGLLFTPVAILTGLATWKYNYASSFITPVKVKLMLSPVLLLQFVAAVIWWMASPAVLSLGGDGAFRFALLVASMLPVMGVIGWFGAGLTFPMHE
jgi:predicted heme/steroid binding protein/uncharacterized membrane protein